MGKRRSRTEYREIKQEFLEKYKANKNLDIKAFCKEKKITVNACDTWLKSEGLRKSRKTFQKICIIQKPKRIKREVKIGQKVVFTFDGMKFTGEVKELYDKFFEVAVFVRKSNKPAYMTSVRYDGKFEIVR